jgi:predicted ATP-dependent serine protease
VWSGEVAQRSIASTPRQYGNRNQMGEVADAESLIAEIETLGGKLQKARQSIGRVIFGQDEVVDQVLITLLSGGHVLLVGVPGLGKTKLVTRWARSWGSTRAACSSPRT